jgi:chromosome segregation ATPase
MPAENILQSLQKIATVVHRLDEVTEDQRELRATFTARFEKLESHVADVRERLEGHLADLRERLEDQVADLRERVIRIEVSRESDRAQLQADLARFKAEVERAEFRIARLLPAPAEPPALPEDGEEEA